MAQTAAVLDIMVKANTGRAVSGLKKTNDSLERTNRQTKKTEGRFLSLSRVGNKSFSLLATGAKAGGLAIGAGLVVGLKKANDEAREAAKVSRLTDAALKSTKGVANVTKREIEDLAEAISVKAGVDDEAVQSSQNLLLTFTKIRNETGKGNKIFTQASHTVADFAARFDKDLNQSAILVGKALNDPIKGVTALNRVGVQFTEQQKEQIKTMVESGDTIGAQKVILGELGVQTRGAAAASADGMARFKVAIDNVFESLGGPLTAALSTAGNAAAKFVTQMQAGEGAGGRFRAQAVAAFNAVRTEITGFVNSLNISRADIQTFVQAVSNVFRAVAAVARAVWPGISKMIRGQLNIISGVVKFWSGLLTLNFRQAWEGVRQIVVGSLQKIIGVIRASPLGAAAATAFNAVKRPATQAFGAVKTAISNAMRGAAKIFGDVMAGILRRFATFFDVAAKIPGVGGKFRDLADKARGAARDIDKVGESADKVNGKKAKVDVTVGVHWPKILEDVFPAISGKGSKGAGWPIQEAVSAVVKKSGQAKVDKLGFEDFMGGSAFGMGTAKGSLGKYEAIGHRFGLQTTSGYRPGDDGWHGKNRARDLSNGSGPTRQMLAYARFMAANFGSSLLELIYSPLGFSIKNGRKVPPYAVGDHYDHVHVAAQRGAMVPGSGSGDKVRALLEPGEGVINKKAVKAMGGGGFINAINSMVPRFAKGGMIGRFSSTSYGPPWNAMNGTGVTRTGVDLRPSKKAYGIAVDPSRIKLGSKVWAWPNPFGYRGPFKAFDTGGAIKGNRLDFYDWRGRSKQMSWGRRAVNVYRSNPWKGGKKPSRRQRKLLESGTKGKGGTTKGVQTWQQQMGISKGIGGQFVDLGTGIRHGINPAMGVGKGIPFTPQRVTRGQDTEGPGEAGEDPRLILAEALKAQAEEAKALRAEIAKSNAFSASVTAVNAREALRFMGDMLSGQLGTMTAQRLVTAGDGVTKARY